MGNNSPRSISIQADNPLKIKTILFGTHLALILSIMLQILICTYDSMLIKGLENPLRDAGFSVTVTDHAASAIRKVMEKLFAAVVLDSQVVGLSVDEALPIIRHVSPGHKGFRHRRGGGGPGRIFHPEAVVPVGTDKDNRRGLHSKGDGMKPREVMIKAFEGGKADRIPVSLFGAGMWSIHNSGNTFQGLSGDLPEDGGHAGQA